MRFGAGGGAVRSIEVGTLVHMVHCLVDIDQSHAIDYGQGNESAMNEASVLLAPDVTSEGARFTIL